MASFFQPSITRRSLRSKEAGGALLPHLPSAAAHPPPNRRSPSPPPRAFPASSKYLLAPALRLASSVYASYNGARHFFYRQGLLRQLGLPSPVISIGEGAVGLADDVLKCCRWGRLAASRYEPLLLPQWRVRMRREPAARPPPPAPPPNRAGNLTNGGTGKTPFVEFLARHYASTVHKMPTLVLQVRLACVPCCVADTCIGTDVLPG